MFVKQKLKETHSKRRLRMTELVLEKAHMPIAKGVVAKKEAEVLDVLHVEIGSEYHV